MAKRILITSTDLMMAQFLLPHVKNLAENGFIVDIACSNVGNKVDVILSTCDGYINNFHLIRTVRSPFSPKNIIGYKDIKNIIAQNEYDIIWTNEPVMGVVTRLAARKKRKQKLLKVLYMAHGFHFYKGAPLINWLLFYPIEWLASFFTDCIVTINHEDFNHSKKLHSKTVEYIHGIGINTDRLNPNSNTQIRKELNLDENTFLVLSVGELNKNKNQQVIIKALSQIDNKNIHYVLCGKGDEENNLRSLCRKLNLSDQVHFLGYRNDVVNICAQADVFVMPSLREGLGLAALEAMYCSLPIISSNVRGLIDIVKNNVSGFLCGSDNYHEFAAAIKYLYANPQKRTCFGNSGKDISASFEIENAKNEILAVVSRTLN